MLPMLTLSYFGSHRGINYLKLHYFVAKLSRINSVGLGACGFRGDEILLKPRRIKPIAFQISIIKFPCIYVAT